MLSLNGGLQFAWQLKIVKPWGQQWLGWFDGNHFGPTPSKTRLSISHLVWLAFIHLGSTDRSSSILKEVFPLWIFSLLKFTAYSKINLLKSDANLREGFGSQRMKVLKHVKQFLRETPAKGRTLNLRRVTLLICNSACNALQCSYIMENKLYNQES